MKTILFLCLITMSSPVWACPSQGGIPDYSCNGQVKISFIGDSLVSGTGDSQHGDRGGYPLRLAQQYRRARIVNAGIAGLNTRQLLLKLETAFTTSREKSLRAAIQGADIVVLDVGRNDRWFRGAASATYRNLKRARLRIQSGSLEKWHQTPLVVTAVLMLPNRGSQGPWVTRLNKLILAGDTLESPANLRFDLVSKRLLNPDGVHPGSKGYDALAATFARYLNGPLRERILRLRPDADVDGIFDKYETEKFGTDPLLRDTDGDGRSDGYEVFTLHSNPLLLD